MAAVFPGGLRWSGGNLTHVLYVHRFRERKCNVFYSLLYRGKEGERAREREEPLQMLIH